MTSIVCRFFISKLGTSMIRNVKWKSIFSTVFEAEKRFEAIGKRRGKINEKNTNKYKNNICYFTTSGILRFCTISYIR